MKPCKGLFTFSNIVVDWNEEYMTLRNKMGTKGCNYNKLIECSTLMSINCPYDYGSDMFRILVKELSQRRGLELRSGLRTFQELYGDEMIWN